jgi:hypothetical protein
MSAIRTILVVTKEDGTIIGAAFPATTDKDGNSTGFAALPGQTVHQVELPENLRRLQSSEEVLRALFDYCVPPGSTCLERSDGNRRGNYSLLSAKED